MTRYIEKIKTLDLPVIPLRGILAFPSIPINFELEREISKNACNAATGSNMMVLLLTQKDSDIDSPDSADDFLSIGCIAEIKNTLKMNLDGNIRVVARGINRAKVKSLHFGDDYITASVLSTEIDASYSKKDLGTEALISKTLESLTEMTKYMPNFSEEYLSAARKIDDPGLLADYIAAALFVRFQDKVKILETFDPLERAKMAIILMNSETKLFEAELEIQKNVRQAMDDNQKEFYLREQIKAIENELGIGEDEDELEKKIQSSHLPKEVSEKLTKELGRLRKMAFSSPDAAVLRNYIETCLEIPWGMKTKDRVDIKAAKKILDDDHDGLDKVKDRILEFLAVKQLNPNIKNQILCLVGPPGTGKTSLGASIAHAMKRKYVRISLGGVRDESDIRGHRKTYIGSMPGRIITALTQCGSMNPVMLLDEVDKMCSDLRGDPASALLEVLDSEQNKAFRDHFIELPVDLSDTLFICTANTLSTIPRPLLDRMEVIELHTYTPTEKLSIAKHHLLPKQLKRHGLDRKKLKISDKTIMALIDGYTRESGVRNLEREIGSLCRKAAKKIIETNVSSISIKCDELEEYLGPKVFIDDEVSKRDLVGVTNGLAYTEVGGDLLKVEVLPVDGSGKIELTGTLGNVMKESAQIAVTYTRAHCDEFGIPADFYKTKDIHIHVPEGAVPKDGPSAGVTLTTSLISALSGLRVRHDIAMTGEITLTGRVLPIGGLREKTTAAYSKGIRTLLIPKENMRDIKELEKEVADSITFIPCSTLEDVLNNALVGNAPKLDLPPITDESVAGEKTGVNVKAGVVPQIKRKRSYKNN